MSDLAPLRDAGAPGLAGRVRRHVVVHQKALETLAVQGLDFLLVASGAESRRHQRLRFAAREKRRAMHPRQRAEANGDRANVARAATVYARFAAQDTLAHNRGFHFFEFRIDEVCLEAEVDDASTTASRAARRISLKRSVRACFFGDAISGGERIADRFLDLRFFGVVQFGRLPIPFGFAGALDQLRDGGDGVLDLRVFRS